MPRVARLLAELSARQQDLPQAIQAVRHIGSHLRDESPDRVRRIEPRRAKPGQRGDTMNLTPDQLHWIGQLSDQWSFLWDKRGRCGSLPRTVRATSRPKRLTWTSRWHGCRRSLRHAAKDFR
jgi:hypothetical protein